MHARLKAVDQLHDDDDKASSYPRLQCEGVCVCMSFDARKQSYLIAKVRQETANEIITVHSPKRIFLSRDASSSSSLLLLLRASG